jgi:hypothetical protein
VRGWAEAGGDEELLLLLFHFPVSLKKTKFWHISSSIRHLLIFYVFHSRLKTLDRAVLN